MSTRFRQAVRTALANPVLQEALDNNAARRKAGAQRANATLADPASVRQHARSIRLSVLGDWDSMLAAFGSACRANGIQLMQAASADEACEHVLAIARAHNVRRVAKSKSMVSEEIRLNTALKRAGLEVVETDLGEYIVQLRGEPPAHIITPALHLRRQEVGRTFAEHLGVAYTEDVSAMTEIARRRLRRVFVTADMGVSGVNLAAANTGTLCLVTNEGNGRMVTTLPRVHVALMGIERLVPSLEDMGVILQLLPRNATGQILTSYVSLIQGPGREDQDDGSPHRYVVLVDNGRRPMQATPLAEALLCIRCGACLNACPVFQEIGGHAYGSPYPGPIGSIVSPGLFGVEAFGHLAKASTLCGACKEACPIGIDIPRMLLQVRQEYAASGSGRRDLRWGVRAFAWAATRPAWFGLGQRLLGAASSLVTRPAGWIRWLPPPGDGWTRSRHFPRFAHATLRRRWRQSGGMTHAQTAGHPVDSPAASNPPATHPAFAPAEPAADRFARALTAVSGEVVQTEHEAVPSRVQALVPEGQRAILACLPAERDAALRQALERAGFQLLDSRWNAGRDEQRMDVSAWGLVRAEAALADSGTVVLPSHPAGTLVASLLPPNLMVLLSRSRIHDDFASWMQAGGSQVVQASPMVVLVTGPSRTSDIEMTMTLGVHGPGRLIVLVTP